MKQDGMTPYKLVYDRRYGSSIRNPWSEEILLQNGVRSFYKDNSQCLWIKTGNNAFCFINNFDEVEHYLLNSSASKAYDYLDTHCDRKEDIKQIVNKYV